MKDECLICRAPLEYLEKDELMECALCHKKELSKTRCVEGHYVCSECHMEGMDSIFGICLREVSKNPVEILEKMMDSSFCHMHGPEHHVMVGAALLTAYRNAAGRLNWSPLWWKCVTEGRVCQAVPVDSGEPAEQGSVQECLSPLSRNQLHYPEKDLRCLIG